MKRIMTILSGLVFILSTCVSIYAVETPTKEEKPKVEQAAPVKEKVKPNVKHTYGEITCLDLEKNIVTIKQEDGTELTLKATTEKTKDMLKELKVGDKVKAGYIKSEEELIILKIFKPEAIRKEKPKKK
ncbi:MAG: hypothetical protein ACK4F0_03065 [Candidatus Ratteibacteria bacterium]